jgi:hypothetical protein
MHLDPQADFFNTIGPKADILNAWLDVRFLTQSRPYQLGW